MWTLLTSIQSIATDSTFVFMFNVRELSLLHFSLLTNRRFAPSWDLRTVTVCGDSNCPALPHVIDRPRAGQKPRIRIIIFNEIILYRYRWYFLLCVFHSNWRETCIFLLKKKNIANYKIKFNFWVCNNNL